MADLSEAVASSLLVEKEPPQVLLDTLNEQIAASDRDNLLLLVAYLNGVGVDEVKTRLGLKRTSVASVDREAAREWTRSAALRDEFDDDKAAFLAFRKAHAAGHVWTNKPASTPTAAHAAARDQSRSAGKDAWEREWERNPVDADGIALQDEFDGDKAVFLAFRKAHAAGHVAMTGWE